MFLDFLKAEIHNPFCWSWSWRCFCTMVAAFAASASASALLRPSRNRVSPSSHGFKTITTNPITISSPFSLGLLHRFTPVASLDSHHSHPEQEQEEEEKEEESTARKDVHELQQWDWWTAKFAAAANIPFLLLQLPQILLNARNLTASNYSSLFAVNWLGALTGLLANLSLLSYFAKKKETEAMIVQCLGVVTTFVVLSQLTLAAAMPFSFFVFTSLVVAAGLISNFLNYFAMLPSFFGDFGKISSLWVAFLSFLR